MPSTIHPAPAAFAGVGVLVALALAATPLADAQDREASAPTPLAFHAALTLPTDTELRPVLLAVPDYIAQRSWPEVARLLQALLDANEDSFTLSRSQSKSSNEAKRWTGVWAEADRRLAALPADGLKSYEALSGSRAKALLAKAIGKGDPALLADVARRYFFTAAGAQAVELLGTWYLDRGRHHQAALWFQRLLTHPRLERLAPLTLFKACLAFRRGGYEDRAQPTWDRLAARAPEGLHLGDRAVPLTGLRKEFDRYQAVVHEPSSASDWRMFRGDPSRGGEAGSAIVLRESRWTLPAVFSAASRTWIHSAVQKQEARSRPVLPAFFPITAAGKVIYRSHRGIHAADLRTGKVTWEVSTPGSLERMVGKAVQSPYLDAWVSGHLADNPQVLFENSVLGSLSTDGSRVYAVDGLEVPPYLNNQLAGGRRGLRQWLDQLEFPSDVNELVYHTKLLAIDVKTGEVAWQLGGDDSKAQSRPLESYFLGPPLPLHGKLYALTEAEQELYLLCLDPGRGDVTWRLKLATIHLKMLLDVRRRLEAAPVAYGHGVLVCPTNAGAVVGVDLLSHRLLWAYPYHEAAPAQAPDSLPQFRAGRWRVPAADVNAQWQASAPIIREGRIVLTAPDSARVHCLNLRDGTPRWAVKRDADDVYLAAVYKGQVVLVGKNHCRALRLADGRELWRVKTGLPSGQGFLTGGVYYLPLKRAAQEAKPAVYAIDLNRGAVVARTLTPKEEVAGNLLATRGRVVSQTASAVTVYGSRTRKCKWSGSD
jgi:outer membrane protein assembly factor BamB